MDTRDSLQKISDAIWRMTTEKSVNQIFARHPFEDDALVIEVHERGHVCQRNRILLDLDSGITNNPSLRVTQLNLTFNSSLRMVAYRC